MMRPPSDIVLDQARVREVAGAFRSRGALEGTGHALLLAGFDRSDIDVIAPPDELRRKLGPEADVIPAEDLADAPFVPRRPFLARTDVTSAKAVVAGLAGSFAAVLTAFIVLKAGGSPTLTGILAALAGLVAAGIGLAAPPRFFGDGNERFDPYTAPRPLIMWVRVNSDEKEQRAREILIGHGARAVRVHEITIAKTAEDLPLGSLRPDPWLGSERLGKP